ncbi:MAG: tyrosine-type recombinase/integrase [Stellaceae bacterium]
MSPTLRRDRVSALNRLCHFAGVAPAMTPASAPEVRSLLGRLNPAYCGLAPSSFKTMVSHIRGALNQYRPGARDDRPSEFVLPASWATLKAAAPKSRGPGDPTHMFALHRFMRFCAQNRWAPEDVNNEKLALFAEYLKREVVIDDEHHVRNLVGAWNWASRNVPGWPQQQLTRERPGRRFTLGWEAFPASLREDLEKYIAFRTRPKLTERHLAVSQADESSKLSRRKPPKRLRLKPTSAEAVRYQIRAIASALVLQGIPAAELTNLSALLNPDFAELALTFFVDRHGGQVRSAQTHQLSWTLLTIGKLWCKLTDKELEPLIGLVTSCQYIQTEMTEKNRRKLVALVDRQIRNRLFNLPETLVKLAQKAKSARRAGYHVQMAVAIEVLLNAPMRVGNLAALETERHFVKGTAGPRAETHIMIPKQEVKNEEDIDFPLSPELIRLIALYNEKYRPVLASGKPSKYLFPTRSGKPIDANYLSTAIATVTKRHLVVQINPQLFRHFAVDLHHEEHPNDFETPQKFLGHKNDATTRKYYSGRDKAAASRSYQETLRYHRSQRGGRPMTAAAPKRVKALPVAAWPSIDQALWIGEPGRRRLIQKPCRQDGYRPATRKTYETLYGQWLAWLTDKGYLDPHSAPASRITGPMILAYINDLQARVRAQSVLSAIEALDSVMAAVANGPHRDLLKTAILYLRDDARAQGAIKRQLVPAGDLYTLGFELMDEAENCATGSPISDAVLFRDGLLIALLTADPVRRKNAHAIRIGENLMPTEEEFWFRYRPAETKNWKHHQVPWSPHLSPLVKQYLQVYRPRLLALRASALPASDTALWLNLKGKPLSYDGFYYIVTSRTRRKFGFAINPHGFRKCCATTLAKDSPERVGLSTVLLDHGSPKVTERHYNLAPAIHANRRRLNSFLSYRRELKDLLGPKRRRRGDTA